MKLRILHEDKYRSAGLHLLLITCIYYLASATIPPVASDSLPLPPPPFSPIFKSTDSGTTWTAITDTSFQVVSALAADHSSPGVLYAGTERGVFKTTDGGSHWVQSNGVVTLFHIETVAVDPVNPSTIYAAGVSGRGGGMLKSEDAGSSWKVTFFGVSGSIYRIVIDPRNHTTLYGNDDYKLYKSTDSGKTWGSILSYRPDDDEVSDPQLHIDPIDNSSLYVTGSNRHFYKTTDGGNSWVDLTDRLAPFSGTRSFFRLQIDPITPALLYSNVYADGNPIGIIKSLDGGNTWEFVTDDRSFHMANLVITSAAPTALYSRGMADLFKSTDQGITWGKTGTPPHQGVFTLDPENSSTIYAGGSYFKPELNKPRITGFIIEGKRLIVIGEFDEGAEILFDGETQPTKDSHGSLISKRGGKQIRKNPDIKIQVRNPDGRLSQELTIWLPPEH